MKIIYRVILIVLFLVICGYLFIRFSFLKTKTVKADNSKAKNIVDLRPQIIAKLQELVKNGSHGLYNLSIDSIEPHVLDAKMDVFKVTLTPDSAALKKLDAEHILSDDVFKISFHSLHIDGFGVDDLLHKNKIDITGIYITDPLIQIFHKKRSYNKEERIKADTSTLYQLLMKDMKRISVGKISIKNATLLSHDLQKNKITRFNSVSINLNNILIDSTTQFDKQRFLFAKTALLQTTDYTLPTPDSLYFLKAGTISIAGEQHKLTATDVHLSPRGNIEQFRKKLKFQKERYDAKVQKLVLNNIDWYDLVNWEKLFAKQATIFKANLNVYFDRSLPPNPHPNLNNFPGQVIMKIGLPVYISKVNIQGFDLQYTEFNPRLSKAGTVYFNNINCAINNFTNMPGEIKKNRFATVKGSALFMHKVPATASMVFDLSKTKTGNFTANVEMKNIDSSIINPIATPLGGFYIKTGFMTDGTATVKGDNYSSAATTKILYNDLRLIPIKKDADKPGGLKKKTVTSFIANTFLIKNENPSKGEAVRVASVSHNRKPGTSFFSFTWKSILAGILKTIGLPTKLADQ